MAVYFVTGNLGGGKSLMSVDRIREYLKRGCPVATNLDIDLTAMLGKHNSSARLIRIPDKPSLEDLEMMGRGTTSYDEKLNGLLVLDECGTWFNSRSWADKERQRLINWLLHARKLGWDVIFIVQSLAVVDKQARVTMAEHVVYCKRTDRMNIPLIGSLFKLLWGDKLPLPRVHIGVVKYGAEQHAITVDTWTSFGSSLFSCYDTKQAFTDFYPHGSHCLLPPSYLKQVPSAVRGFRYLMRMTKVYFKRMKVPVVYAVGVLSCFFLTGLVNYFSAQKAQANIPEKRQESVVISSKVEEMHPDPQTSPPGSDSLESEKRQENVTFQTVKLSHFERFYKNKKPEIFILHDGVYPLSSFPYPVSIKKGVYYADIPTKSGI